MVIFRNFEEPASQENVQIPHIEVTEKASITKNIL